MGRGTGLAHERTLRLFGIEKNILRQWVMVDQRKNSEIFWLTFTKVVDMLPVEMMPQRRTCGCGEVAMAGLYRLQQESLIRYVCA